MSTTTISLLRQRTIEDMTARKRGPHSQRSHIESCVRFAAFLKRSPATATPDDVRLFQLDLIESGLSIPNRNRIMSGVKFLFRVALRRLDLVSEVYHMKEPEKVPPILNQDETRRRLAMAGCLRDRLLLGRDSGLKAIDRAKTSPYVSAMTVRPIITLPDPLLRQASAPVERFDEDIRKLADDMLETMYAAPGVGLAAVQVGVPIRLIVLDTAKDEEPPRPLVLINPEILTLGSELRLHEEGCLSIPDVRVEIARPGSVGVRYLDLEGKPQELAAEGLLATAIQHEIDHLNGRLIIDFLSRLKRDIIVRKFRKQAKAEASA